MVSRRLASVVLAAAVGVVALQAGGVAGARDPADCEVCLKALNTVAAKLTADDRKSLTAIEERIGNYCAKPPTEKEAKLCYYLDPIKREISNPLKNGVPVDRVCERLKKKSTEICALRFAATAPVVAEAVEDFSKLRIKDLKSIMLEKGITCPECIEKADFVAKLEAVLGKGAKKEL